MKIEIQTDKWARFPEVLAAQKEMTEQLGHDFSIEQVVIALANTGLSHRG